MSSGQPPFPPRQSNHGGVSSNLYHNSTPHHSTDSYYSPGLEPPGSGGSMVGSGDGSSIGITLEEYLKVGSVIKATTIHGKTYQGEIMAVDNKTHLVFLSVSAVATVGNNSNSSSSQVNMLAATSTNNNITGSTSSNNTNSSSGSSSSARNNTTPHNPSSHSSNLGGGGANGAHDVVMLNLTLLKDLTTIKELPTSSQLAPLASIRISEAEQRLKTSVEKKLKKAEYVGIGVSPEAQALFDKLKIQYDCSWAGSTIKVDSLKVTIHEPYYEKVCVSGESKNSVDHVRNLIEQNWRALKVPPPSSSHNSHSNSSQSQNNNRNNNGGSGGNGGTFGTTSVGIAANNALAPKSATATTPNANHQQQKQKSSLNASMSGNNNNNLGS